MDGLGEMPQTLMVPASRVKAWAIARSIYRTACLLGIEEKKKIPLKPMILNQKLFLLVLTSYHLY